MAEEVGTAWWRPANESDIQAAIDAGLLAETHYLDLKREIEATRSGNKELARDLASFAVDGGTLVVGVEETDDGPALYPVPLGGLPERVDQVARSLIDPPLPITITRIPSSADPDTGYLVIGIESSPLSPHMTDGRYYGRGDKTKHQLTDAEVVRLHQMRQLVQDQADAVIEQLVSRDPVNAEGRSHAHLFFIARPTRSPSGMALPLIRNHEYWTPMRELLNEAARGKPVKSGNDLLQWVTSPAHRSDGVALATGLTSDRRSETSSADPEDVVEVEITETGEVRIFVGRLSDSRSDRSTGQPVEVLDDDWVPELVREGVALAAAVALRFGYRGPWLLGLALTNVAGLTPASALGGLSRQTRSVEATSGDYREWVSAASDDLVKRPGSLTSTLAGRFLRGVRREHVHVGTWLADPTPDVHTRQA